MAEKRTESSMTPANGKRLRIAGTVALFLLLIGASFALAGRWDWTEGWLFYTVYLIYVIALVRKMARTNPGLLQERQNPGKNVESWDKVVMALYTPLLLLLLAIAALDSGRYRWSQTPLGAQLAAWLALGLVGAAIWRIMLVNAYLSGLVRIQHDRGHQVVTTGLYRYVRHPMYLAIIVGMFCLALALGSYWALIPAALIATLFLYRTAREDLTLIEKLPGYREYAQRVRYRLIPGLW